MFTAFDHHPICRSDIELARLIKARELVEAERSLAAAKAREREARSAELEALAKALDSVKPWKDSEGETTVGSAAEAVIRAIERLAKLS